MRIQKTNEERGLRAIGSAWCDLYHCEAFFFIRDYSFVSESGRHVSGRELVVQYGPGYTGREDLPIAANGRREFAGEIPSHRSEEDVIALLLTPPIVLKETKYVKNYPTWEVGARYFGFPWLAWPNAAPTISREETKQ